MTASLVRLARLYVERVTIAYDFTFATRAHFLVGLVPTLAARARMVININVRHGSPVVLFICQYATTVTQLGQTNLT
jgi:hypothetical protein